VTEPRFQTLANSTGTLLNLIYQTQISTGAISKVALSTQTFQQVAIDTTTLQTQITAIAYSTGSPSSVFAGTATWANGFRHSQGTGLSADDHKQYVSTTNARGIQTISSNIDMYNSTQSSSPVLLITGNGISGPPEAYGHSLGLWGQGTSLFGFGDDYYNYIGSKNNPANLNINTWLIEMNGANGVAYNYMGIGYAYDNLAYIKLRRHGVSDPAMYFQVPTTINGGNPVYFSGTVQAQADLQTNSINTYTGNNISINSKNLTSVARIDVSSGMNMPDHTFFTGTSGVSVYALGISTGEILNSLNNLTLKIAIDTTTMQSQIVGSGSIGHGNFTLAQLRVLLPPQDKAGYTVYCTDDTDLYVSTGTLQGAWVSTRTKLAP
jgi:hypothetical protein